MEHSAKKRQEEAIYQLLIDLYRYYRFEHQVERTYVISATKLLINHDVKNSYQRTTE